MGGEKSELDSREEVGLKSPAHDAAKRKPMKASPFGGERGPAIELNASVALLSPREARERQHRRAETHTHPARGGAGYSGDSEAGILSGISRKCRMRSGFY